MLIATLEGIEAASIMDRVLGEFADGMVSAVPNVLSGIVFLVLSYFVIKLVLFLARGVFERIYPVEQQLITDLSVAVVGIFMWFGVALALLKIVGLGDVAASLGTAAGFIGLGVAFALKEMIADTVAGVYLLRDRDFNHGDHVDTADVSGTITDIDLRKTRIRTEEGDLMVIPNREVEKRWRQRTGGPGPAD